MIDISSAIELAMYVFTYSIITVIVIIVRANVKNGAFGIDDVFWIFLWVVAIPLWLICRLRRG